jgi:hypothetical protein
VPPLPPPPPVPPDAPPDAAAADEACAVLATLESIKSPDARIAAATTSIASVVFVLIIYNRRFNNLLIVRKILIKSIVFIKFYNCYTIKHKKF